MMKFDMKKILWEAALKSAFFLIYKLGWRLLKLNVDAWLVIAVKNEYSVKIKIEKSQHIGRNTVFYLNLNENNKSGKSPIIINDDLLSSYTK